jgi:hypothetical protein
MALRYFHTRREVHGLCMVRRPVRTVQNASIKIEVVSDPERLNEICGGCRLPWGLAKRHSHGLCNTFVVRAWRDSKGYRGGLIPVAK